MLDRHAQSTQREVMCRPVRPVPTWFKIVSWFMAAYFAMCVGLQYNDPDPIRWMAIYGAAMVFSIFVTRKQLVRPTIVVGTICSVWGSYLVYRVWGVVTLSDIVTKMSEKGGAVEEEREAGGLVIEAAWLFAASWFRSRRS